MLSNKVLFVLLAGVLLSACSSDEQSLTQAAEARWSALIRGEMDDAYRYYTQAFQDTTSLEMFKQTRHSGLWKEAKVKQIQCDEPGKQCEVAMEVTVVVRMRGLSQPMESSSTLREVWVKEGWLSDWRYVNR